MPSYPQEILFDNRLFSCYCLREGASLFAPLEPKRL
jgi:hypothetical protein